MPSMDNSELRARLAAALNAAEYRWLNEPVIWGRSDCLMSCADVLAGPLGFDPAADYRGRYSTARGFKRILHREGFGDLRECLDWYMRNVLHWRRIRPGKAEIGDFGLWQQTENVWTCALYHGAGLWAVRGERGAVFAPTLLIDRAWKVKS